jgi:hypothetical protein
MSDRSDKDDPKLKDNVDPRLEPKNAKNPDRAPRGAISMPSPPSPGKSSVQPADRFSGMTADHQRQKDKSDRTTEKDNRPAFRQTGDHEVDRFYSKENKMIPKDDDRQH